MKKLILASAFIAAAGLGGVAAAQTTADVSATATAQVPASNAAPVAETGTRQVPPADSRFCIRDTGSHIPPPKGGCLPVSGTSYSHEDIERTGALTVGQALQQLDPSITVYGH